MRCVPARPTQTPFEILGHRAGQHIRRRPDACDGVDAVTDNTASSHAPHSVTGMASAVGRIARIEAGAVPDTGRHRQARLRRPTDPWADRLPCQADDDCPLCYTQHEAAQERDQPAVRALASNCGSHDRAHVEGDRLGPPRSAAPASSPPWRASDCAGLAMLGSLRSGTSSPPPSAGLGWCRSCRGRRPARRL